MKLIGLIQYYGKQRQNEESFQRGRIWCDTSFQRQPEELQRKRKYPSPLHECHKRQRWGLHYSSGSMVTGPTYRLRLTPGSRVKSCKKVSNNLASCRILVSGGWLEVWSPEGSYRLDFLLNELSFTYASSISKLQLLTSFSRWKPSVKIEHQLFVCFL